MFKTVVRALAFASKELAEIRRQPRLIAAMILGPFLILLLFGLGYNVAQPPLHTVLVVPPGSGMSTSRAAYARQFPYPFVLDRVTQSTADAERMVQNNTEDVAVVLPSNVGRSVLGGHHADLRLYYKQIDPVYGSWIPYFGQTLVAQLNQRIEEGAIARLQDQARRAGSSRTPPPVARLTRIPPGVLAAPLSLRTHNFASTPPTLVAFYAPGVLALLLQHLAVSLCSLSIIRERLLGALEVFRVAPIGKAELFFGKYVGYTAITFLVGVILVALMYFGLGIPILAPKVWIGASMLTLILGATSVGFLVSTLSRSESQAVQISMVVLLASIFFSGFFLPLSTLAPYVQVVSFALPVTYGIYALKDVMLLGQTPDWWSLGGPLAIGLICLVCASWLLARDLARQ